MNQLLTIYYGLFHSIVVYGIIGCGGLYDNTLDPLVRLQERLFNIIGIAEHDDKKPLEIRKVFAVKVIIYLYQELKNASINKSIHTRFKSISLSKH